MPSEKSLQNLKKFSSTYQPKNNGRKPSKLRKYIKDNNLGIDDIRLVMKQVLAMDEEKLNEKIADTKAPMMIRLFIKAYLTDFKKGTLDNFEKLLDRVYGKATQNVEMQGGLEITRISREERQAMLKDWVRDFVKDNPEVLSDKDDKKDQ